MMRRQLPRTAPFIAAVLLTACSGGSSTSPGTQPVPTQPSTAAATSTNAALPTTTAAPPKTVAPTTVAPTTLVSTTTVVVPHAPTIDELLARPGPLVLAHAGGENAHPHSTPYGFADSAAAGVDMLDMDVQLTADGVLVVQHDDTVDRTTNATGRVDSFSYEALARLDNAYWFTPTCTCQGEPDASYVLRGMRTGTRPPLPGYTADDFVIPRFRDIATRFAMLPLNIEIKGEGESAVRTARVLADELGELARLDSVVVASFDDAIVEAFHQMAPTVEVSPAQDALTAWVLGRTPLPDYMRILQPPDVFGDVDVLGNDLVPDSHAVGYRIWVWPNSGRATETAEGYRRLFDTGIDAINAADPAVALTVVAR